MCICARCSLKRLGFAFTHIKTPCFRNRWLRCVLDADRCLPSDQGTTDDDSCLAPMGRF